MQYTTEGRTEVKVRIILDLDLLTKGQAKTLKRGGDELTKMFRRVINTKLVMTKSRSIAELISAKVPEYEMTVTLEEGK